MHNVPVEAQLDGREDWLVEKVVIGTEDAGIMATPTTWISSACPYLPVANPGQTPRYIRAGEVLGHLVNPEEFIDASDTEEACVQHVSSAEAIKTVIEGTLCTQELNSLKMGNLMSSSGQLEGEVNWGPKTTTLPDEKVTSNIVDLVDLSPDIPNDVYPELARILQENAAAFGVNRRLGRVPSKVDIPLQPGSRPISIPMYGTSPAKKEVIDNQLKKWLEADIIEASTSPWGFPMVVDYRKLNAMTIPDEFPIPCQSEIIQSLSGTQVISTFNVLAGFMQLEMAEEVKECTAFYCYLGLWQFKCMPFGLRDSPSVFQRLMQGVLAPYLWLFTLVFIDDIVVYSKSWKDHLNHIDKVLYAIVSAGIMLSPSKCHIGYSSILLLGQKVSWLGLFMHQEKVQAIMGLAKLTSIHKLQKFLEMAIYFAAYIPYYSFIAAPLFRLLKKGCKWAWRAEHDIAFQQLKDASAGAPILGHPCQGSPYRLYTDTSDYVIGASLQQVQLIAIKDLKGTAAYDHLLKAWEQEKPPPSLVTSLAKDILEATSSCLNWGATFNNTMVPVKRVIAYWSQPLKSVERNYSATEKEVLGAKEALVKFQLFIEGETIILVTDHTALQWARVYENTNQQLAVWGAVYAAYPGLHIVHHPGQIHSNVDPLSRLLRIPLHNSPTHNNIEHIEPEEGKVKLAQEAEDKGSTAPAKKAAFVVWWWEDVVDKYSYGV
jgi:hypothetical protein